MIGFTSHTRLNLTEKSWDDLRENHLTPRIGQYRICRRLTPFLKYLTSPATGEAGSVKQHSGTMQHTPGRHW